ITLNRDDVRRAFQEQGTRQTSGPGADFHDGHVFERPGRTCDPARQVEILDEVLPEALFRTQIQRADHLAQGRQTVGSGGGCAGLARRAHAEPTAAMRRAAMRCAIPSAASRLEGEALPVPAMSKAVPWSGDVRTKGRPSVTLTPRSNANVLSGI